MGFTAENKPHTDQKVWFVADNTTTNSVIQVTRKLTDAAHSRWSTATNKNPVAFRVSKSLLLFISLHLLPLPHTSDSLPQVITASVGKPIHLHPQGRNQGVCDSQGKRQDFCCWLYSTVLNTEAVDQHMMKLLLHGSHRSGDVTLWRSPHYAASGPRLLTLANLLCHNKSPASRSFLWH